VISVTTPTLAQYEQAERDLSLHEAGIGLRIHAFITVVVWAALIPINVIVAPEFPWVVFPIAGMALGLFFHWFGYRHAEADIRRRQADLELRAMTYTGS
jgi:hypothetical protein